MGVYQWIYFKLPVLQLAELTEEVSLVTVSPVNALSTSALQPHNVPWDPSTDVQ